VFSIVPGLELTKSDSTSESGQNGESQKNGEKEDGWALFALQRDLLTSNSTITQIGAHRKLFNDCFVNFLRNKVFNPSLFVFFISIFGFEFMGFTIDQREAL